jgi:hypothetical protein
MEEIESKFTGVHGTKLTGGIDPTPSRTCFATGTADSEAWRGSGGDLGQWGRQGTSRGTGVDGEE